MITQKIIRQIIDYNQETGLAIWKKRPLHLCGSIRIKKAFDSKYSGKQIGSTSVNKDGKSYTITKIFGKCYSLHRIIWLYIHGQWPEDQIDHINGNGMDNRLINLRSVTAFENMKNTKMRSNSKSKCTGVTWHKRQNKWRARINHEKKEIYLGHFDQLEDAIEARRKAEKQFDFHENHGSVRSL